MMESINKLRFHVATRSIDSHDKDVKVSGKTVLDALNAIDDELSEKYMLLPVDADGVPIHVGDTVIDFKTERSVVAIAENVIVMDGYTDGDSIRIGYAFNHHHVKPRMVVDVLLEFVDRYNFAKGGCDEEGVVEKYVAELYELLGGDA